MGTIRRAPTTQKRGLGRGKNQKQKQRKPSFSKAVISDEKLEKISLKKQNRNQSCSVFNSAISLKTNSYQKSLGEYCDFPGVLPVPTFTRLLSRPCCSTTTCRAQGSCWEKRIFFLKNKTNMNPSKLLSIFTANVFRKWKKRKKAEFLTRKWTWSLWKDVLCQIKILKENFPPVPTYWNPIFPRMACTL